MSSEPTAAARRLGSVFNHVAGIVFLALARGKHLLRGYATPRTIAAGDLAACARYDAEVVTRWRRFLEDYAGEGTDVAGRRILELGPGGDLGIGLILLALGARRYRALDVHDLALRAPAGFYERLWPELERVAPGADLAALSRQLEATLAGRPDRLRYDCRADFDLAAALEGEEVDLVVSQAAFEHFDDVERTLAQTSAAAGAGAVLLADIDLKTHSRWIRDRDPNNIYRYPDWLYRLFRFRGAPNRLRPRDYEEILRRHGWRRIRWFPTAQLDPAEVARLRPGLAARFRGDENRMEWLSAVVCATREGT